MATSRALVLASLLAGAAGCAAARPALAPDRAALVGAAGPTTPEELRGGRDALVLVFWSGTCPCVRRYQARVDALLETWPADRVRVVGVSSNAGESRADAVRVAAERQVRIPILRDEGGELARALGVQTTPTVVVLDAKGAVRYLGWLDNERLPGDPGREAWLDRAIAGVLDGATRFAARSPVYGCPITRSLLRPEHAACCSVH